MYDKILDAVNKAFESLAGDQSAAIQSAEKFASYDDSVQRWVSSEATKASVAAGAYLLPGVHLVALPADIAFVLHTMGVCAWGVGHLLGCSVEGKPDLQMVLGLWSGAIPQDRIDTRLQEAAKAGYIVFLPDGVPQAQEGLANYLVGEYSQPIAPAAVPMGTIKTRLAQKIAAKVTAKLLPKFAVKAFAGFIAVAGVAAIAWINKTFVQDFGRSAQVYYQAKRRLQQTRNEPQASQPQPSISDQLRQVQKLKDENLITQAEYEQKRKEILDRLG